MKLPLTLLDEKKMKILLVDQDNVGLSFVLRCLAAGHQVRWFDKPKPTADKRTGAGFKGVEKIDNWVSSAGWADLIFCTANGDYIERLEFFRKKGYPVFAPSVASASLEISRKKGMELLEKHGIECAPYKTFATMKEAERHVMKTEERFVFKTLGDNEDKSLTYVSKGPGDLVGWMRRTPPPKGEVMLQTFIEGIEMGVSRFMGSKGWVGQWNESFEHKKLMPGNFGPNTGEMGTVAYFTSSSKLGDETLAKCQDALLAMDHRGDVALGFMIDEKGKPWPTEWTCRPGWPIFNMMLGAIKDDPAQWMLDAIKGKDTTSFKEDIGGCLVVAAGSFPHGELHQKKDPEYASGTPIYGITKGVQVHTHPVSVMVEDHPTLEDPKSNKPTWTTSGDYVAIVTGYGATVSQCMKRAYGTVKKLHLSNMVVRDDVGEGLKEQLPKLHQLGYATHCRYA